jgi:hypothetical protein
LTPVSIKADPIRGNRQLAGGRVLDLLHDAAPGERVVPVASV